MPDITVKYKKLSPDAISCLAFSIRRFVRKSVGETPVSFLKIL